MSAQGGFYDAALTRRVIARNKIKEKLGFGILGIATASIVLPILLLFGYIIHFGVRQINWDFLSKAPNAVDASGGIFPALVGTAYLLLGTIAIALPLGVASAIYTSEYASQKKWVRLVRTAMTNLAGVPSIVHGLFGLGFFVLFVGGGIDKFILHTDKPVWGQPCLLWGFCTLAVVILPNIITSTEEALQSVPQTFREASLALGGSRWQTVRRVVLPAALPGVLTGTVLGIGRAAGETAPVMITCAASFKPTLPSGLSDQAMLLPYHLYFVSTQVPNPSLELRSGIALVLISLVFVASLSCGILRSRSRRLRKW